MKYDASTSGAGRYVITSILGETVRAFVPPPLPLMSAFDPARFYGKLDLANQAIGRLDGLQSTLPNVGLLLYFYNRREAVLSSQIEGTQSSLADLLLYEHQHEAVSGDVEEVSNYVAAMQHGLSRIRSGFPLSNRLLKEMHSILLRSGRGAEQQPGEFRRSQNWIGGSRPGNAVYVPPPVAEMEEVMSNLEKYLHRETAPLPLLMDAAVAHAYFESAHPFLDGNGRIGRLLITLLLCERGVLREPSLYLSLYLKQNRDRYYELLQRTRTHAEWEPWLEFFLEGVRVTADEACSTALKAQHLFSEDRDRIRQIPRAGSLLQVHEYLQHIPITDLQSITSITKLAQGTAGTAIEKLQTLGIVSESTGRRRGRIFTYKRFLNMLDEGTNQPFRGVR